METRFNIDQNMGSVTDFSTQERNKKCTGNGLLCLGQDMSCSRAGLPSHMLVL